MADKHTDTQEVKFSFSFDDTGDPAQWISFPNPLTLSDIKGGLSTIENLALDNKLLVGKNLQSAVKEMDDVKVIYKSETSLDWRS